MPLPGGLSAFPVPERPQRASSRLMLSNLTQWRLQDSAGAAGLTLTRRNPDRARAVDGERLRRFDGLLRCCIQVDSYKLL